MTTDRARWRVEELARRADVSVDTIRFYQKRRLLPPPEREGRVAWYGPEHLDRLARIRELRAQGLTLALIGRMLDGDLDADRRAARGRGRGRRRRSARRSSSRSQSSAERSGVPDALLEAVAREALARRRACTTASPRYTTADIAVVQQGLRLLEQGLPLPDLLALAHEHHETTRDIAETAVALFDRYVRAPLRASDLPDDGEGRAARRGVPHAAAGRDHARRASLPARAARSRAGASRIGRRTRPSSRRSTPKAARRLEGGLADMTDVLPDRRTRSRASSKRCSTASRRATTR